MGWNSTPPPVDTAQASNARTVAKEPRCGLDRKVLTKCPEGGFHVLLGTVKMLTGERDGHLHQPPPRLPVAKNKLGDQIGAGRCICVGRSPAAALARLSVSVHQAVDGFD